MTSLLHIALLGRFQVMRDGTPVSGIESDRGRALLAYLAVEGDRAHRRDGLGALLWPDTDEGRMRQNLRRALYNLRKSLDLSTAAEPLLLVTPYDVQLNPQSTHGVDVVQFRALVNQCQHHAHPALTACPECHQRLSAAVALYRGDFLTGFTLPTNERFEEWRLFTQEALHVMMLDTLGNLAAFHTARQEYAQAIAYLQRQIELEPWREEAHRALMRLFAARGDRSAALAQYALCTRLLAEELGAPPAAETDHLYEQILRGSVEPSQERPPSASGQPPAASPTPLVLPALATPFLGRQHELALIAQQLAEPTCRLLTLVGLGGVGKTQLALAAALALAPAAENAGASHFPSGIYFVNLADLGVPAPTDHPADELLELRIAAAIAAVVGVEFQPEASPLAQLSAYLRDKACLLILDNYEHLLGGADLVSQLLAAAPCLKLLVTSRQPLQQPEEWCLPLEGLRVPTDSAEENVAHYESVALFVQWARRKQSYFALDVENQGPVVEICQLVDGLPLGIVLAAACYPELTCAEIGAEIRRNLIILAAEATTAGTDPASDLTRRHRNLQAVFEASWQLLTPAEQRTLSRAAVFQGGFSRQAGLQITGATLGELSGLVTRVLLRRTSAGRYVMHELLRQFVAAKLAESTELQANAPYERHSRYYLDWVMRQAPAFVSTELPQAVAAIRLELSNVRLAWQWAAHHGAHELVADSVEVVTEFYEASGLLGEAEQLFATTVETLHTQAPTPAQAACTAKVTLALLQMFWGQGNLVATEAWLPRATELVQGTADPTLHFNLVRARLHLRMAQGAYEEAEPIAVAAWAAAEQSGDPQLRLLAKLDQGKLALSRHRYAEAQSTIEEALRIGERSINPLVQDSIFLFLGRAAYYQGAMAQAKAYDEQGIHLARALGLRLRIADHLLHLGTVYDALGDYGAAQGAYQEALAIYRERGARQHEISVLGNLGISTAYLGDYAGAIRYTQQAMTLQSELGKVNQSAIAFTNLALFYHQVGEQVTAGAYAQQGITAAQAEGDRYIAGFAHTFHGHALSALGESAAAQAAYAQALGCYEELGLGYLTPEPQAGLARLWLAQGDVAAARTAIEPILRLIEERPLEGIEEPMRVYHTCYQVLAATGDAAARSLLQLAYAQLQARADRIQEAAARTAFLNHVTAHRALAADYLAG